MEKKKQNAKVQYLAALVVSLLGIVYGIITGWSSPSILLLTSDASPLSTGTITMEEASWMTALNAVGIMFGSTIFGFVANKFGRKWPLFFLTIPTIISWILIWFAENVYYIYVARLMHGIISAGIFGLSQFYFVEISDDRIRGALGSAVIVSGHIGVPIAMALGAYFSYEAIPICAIAITLLFGFIFFFFPETPLFLVKQNKISKAEQSIRFYKNVRGKHDAYYTVQFEIEKQKRIIGDTEKKCKINSVKWSDLVNNPGKKGMVIGIFLAVLDNFSGSFALMNYTATIFEESGSVMSSNESALFVGIIQVIGTTLLPFLVDRIGRKVLYIMSTAGSIVGFTVLGLYIMLKSWEFPVDGIAWIPIVSFSFIVFSQSLAISTLSLAVTPEILPENLREFGVSFCNTSSGASAFIVLKFMPFFTDLLGFYGTMFLFGGICVPSLLFIIFYMPETKGKSYEEIMKLLQ